MYWWEERKDVLVREKTRLDKKYPLNDFQFEIEDGYLWLKGTIHIEKKLDFHFPFELKYPKSYPFAPPFIYPKDKSSDWVPGHQFILNGRFCLDIREHNWDPNFSGVDIIESMATLINARVDKYLKKTDKLSVLEGVEPTILETKTKDKICLYSSISSPFKNESGVFKYFTLNELFDNRIIILPDLDFKDILASAFFNIWDMDIFSDKKGIYLKVNLSNINDILGCKKIDELYSCFETTGIIEKQQIETLVTDNESSYILLVDEILKPIVLIKLNKAESDIKFYGLYEIDFEKIFNRIPNKEEKTLLSNCKVTIIGCGSGGSSIAEYLVKSGVSKLVLIDSEILEVENVLRHTCTLKDIGLKKVLALKNRLKTINPIIEVTTIEKNIDSFTEEIDSKIKNSDLIINAIGNSESMVNAYSYLNKITTIHCKVYPFGFGGEVLRIIPDVTPCYDCLYKYLNTELEEIPIHTEFPHDQTINYNITNEGETIPIPSLAVDAGFIINITSKMAIETLLSSKKDLKNKQNIILWGNKKEWIFNEEFSCLKVETKLSKSYNNCIVCHNHDAIHKEVNMDESEMNEYYSAIQIKR
ncbi:MAG: ThiF family adenylyltransferase [Bacteroidales bacterium]|nr:ThiF family adenylyltransferase [Bacteroidales bacterium]